ncbi:hypothetical protein V1477_000257 [Vespula maculifrons]|uniref:Uncharacterized protein n=1 Tax=Vespula maculifrons TaxID=7453 RepID=A0ABD2D2E4_VESMC
MISRGRPFTLSSGTAVGTSSTDTRRPKNRPTRFLISLGYTLMLVSPTTTR